MLSSMKIPIAYRAGLAHEKHLKQETSQESSMVEHPTHKRKWQVWKETSPTANSILLKLGSLKTATSKE